MAREYCDLLNQAVRLVTPKEYRFWIVVARLKYVVRVATSGKSLTVWELIPQSNQSRNATCFPEGISAR
jgi:hypothetical protein